MPSQVVSVSRRGLSRDFASKEDLEFVSCLEAADKEWRPICADTLSLAGLQALGTRGEG
jgi:hypothetical protein